MKKISEYSLSNDDAAAFLNIKPGTLSKWRCYGINKIPFAKVGRFVRYRQADLENFIKNNVFFKNVN